MREKKATSGPWRLPFAAAILLASLTTSLLASCSFTSQEITTPSNRYALVIGVQDYENISDLSYPDEDAQDFSALLIEQGWTVKNTLVNSEATSSAIQAAIADLSSDKNASVLVYYSGHGTTLNGKAYILPYDTDAIYTNNMLSGLVNAISATSLIEYMGAVTAKNRVLILDSCYSGGFTSSANAVDTLPADYSKMNGKTLDMGILLAAISNLNNLIATNFSLLETRDIVALSAAGSDEVSWDDSGSGHGAFTNYLLKAAGKGDSDGDGYVTVAEAYNYAKRQIKANWNADYWSYRDGYGDYSYDFLPHISGGTGDIALYVPEN